MKIYPLPKSAEIYWLGVKQAGIYRRFSIGCYFKGCEERTVTNLNRVDEYDFYNEHCRSCSHNFTNNHNLQDLINKNQQLCNETINYSYIDINRILRTVISAIVEVTGAQYKKELLDIEECEGHLEEQIEKLLTWEIKVNELGIVIVGEPNLVSFIDEFIRELNINLTEKQKLSVTTAANTLIKNNKSDYIDRFSAAEQVKYFIEDTLDRNTTCKGGFEVYDEGDCIAAENDSLKITEQITVVIPPHTFVVVEPQYAYMYNNSNGNYDVGLPLICGNVYGDGSICWGHDINAEPKMENIAFLYEYFWSSKFINDLGGDAYSIEEEISEDDYAYTSIISEHCQELDNTITENFETTKEKLVGLITLSHKEYLKFVDSTAVFSVSPIVGDENIASFVYADLDKKQLFIYDNVVSKIGTLSSADKTQKLLVQISKTGVIKLVREKVKK